MRIVERARAWYWWMTRVLSRWWFHWGFQGTLEKQAKQELSNVRSRLSRWSMTSFEEAGRVIGVQAADPREGVTLMLLRSVRFRYRHYDGWAVEYFVDPVGLDERDWWRVRRQPRVRNSFLGVIDSAGVSVFIDRIEQRLSEAAARAADLAKREIEFAARVSSESDSQRRAAERSLTELRGADERHRVATDQAWTTIRNASARLPGLTLRVSEQEATAARLRESLVRALNEQRAAQRAAEESLRVVSEIPSYPASPSYAASEAEWVRRKGATSAAMRLTHEQERAFASGEAELALRRKAVAAEQDVITRARAEWTRSEHELRTALGDAAEMANQCENAANVTRAIQTLRASATAAGLDAASVESAATLKRHWHLSHTNTLDTKRHLVGQIRSAIAAVTTRLNECRKRVDTAAAPAQLLSAGNLGVQAAGTAGVKP